MCPQVLPHLALDLAGVRHDVVEVAVLDDQGCCLLGTDAGNAGDVIGRIALESIEVGDQIRGDAVIEVVHRFRRHDLHVGDALLRRDDLHMVRCKLVHVAVARKEEHIVASILALLGKGAQDIVTLPAFAFADRHIEGAQKLLHHRELLVERFVHGRALRLVLRQHIDPHLRLAFVEGTDDAVRLERLDHLDEHVEEAEEGIRGTSVRCAHRLHDCVIGAVHEGIAVDNGNAAALLFRFLGSCFFSHD